MGADTVYFYFGVRRTIAHQDEEQKRQLENDSHPIYDLAFKHKLHVAWGCLTDGADYFLLIGHEIGRFGVEGTQEKTFADSALTDIAQKTKAKLIAAGILESPAFLVQLAAQY